jgi:hypothetical protein
MPLRKRGRRKQTKVSYARWVGRVAYVFAFVVAFVNLLFPASALTPLSINYWSPKSYYWTLTIPPVPQGFLPEFNETAVFNVTVSASQPFADGVSITIYVVGCEKSHENVTTDEFKVGFAGAYDQKNPGTVYNGYSVVAWSFVYPLSPPGWPNKCPTYLGSDAVHFIGETYDTTFYFENPGTYPVSIKANYWPNLFGTPKQYDYPNNTIVVQSSSSLNQGVRDFGIGIVIFAGALATFIDGIPYFKRPQSPPSPATEGEKQRQGGAGIQ